MCLSRALACYCIAGFVGQVASESFLRSLFIVVFEEPEEEERFYYPKSPYPYPKGFFNYSSQHQVQ